jgi:hypothetical protein
MALECASTVDICALRATRLNDDGTPADPPNNVYVVQDLIQLQFTPNIKEGTVRELVGGCGGCDLAYKEDEDVFQRFDLELQAARLEPGLLEMLLGTAVIQDSTDLIGAHLGVKISCGTPRARVALEAWSTRWLPTDEPDPVYPHIHWLWVSTAWTLGQNTLQADFGPVVLSGKSRANSAWSIGPYGDQPEAALGQAMFWFDAGELPTATCDYSDQNIAT